MIDGYMIRRTWRDLEREETTAKRVLEGYAWSLGIITSAWDCEDNEPFFAPINQWEEMLARL